MKSNPSNPTCNIKKKFLFFCARTSFCDTISLDVYQTFSFIFSKHFFGFCRAFVFIFRTSVWVLCIGLLWIYTTHFFFQFFFSLHANANMQCTFSSGKPFLCYNYHYCCYLVRIFTFIVDCLMHWRYEIATLVTANCLGARAFVFAQLRFLLQSPRYEKAKRTWAPFDRILIEEKKTNNTSAHHCVLIQSI